MYLPSCVCGTLGGETAFLRAHNFRRYSQSCHIFWELFVYLIDTSCVVELSSEGKRYQMQARIDYMKVNPAVLNALRGVTSAMKSGLELSLVDLVLVRASQINHCAMCLDMHVKDARASGETEQRLYSLDAWRECPYYTDRERAALAWTEAVTLVTDGFVPDEVYEQAWQQFSEAELVDLTLLVVGINGWNRFNVSFRTVPGAYQSQRKPAAQPVPVHA